MIPALEQINDELNRLGYSVVDYNDIKFSRVNAHINECEYYWFNPPDFKYVDKIVAKCLDTLKPEKTDLLITYWKLADSYTAIYIGKLINGN